MDIQDNVLKEYLKNVYFICGTACGGKTTAARALGEMYGVPVYDIDERFPVHQRVSDAAYQPCMNRRFKDADEFFGRSVEEYRDWLLRNLREQLDFILLDLVRLSQNGRIICDSHITVEQVALLTEPTRCVFLIKEPVYLIDEYCDRPDHKDFSDYINSASDVESAKAVCNETLCSINALCVDAIKKSGFFWLERDGKRSARETACIIAGYFGW